MYRCIWLCIMLYRIIIYVYAFRYMYIRFGTTCGASCYACGALRDPTLICVFILAIFYPPLK